jgi:Zn-dependent peptidase ImmA (M78 family)
MKTDHKILFGKRLRQARVMRGLSLRELAKEMSEPISHNALARYERGEMMPGSKVLIAVANALKQPPGFFVRPQKVAMSDIAFRKKADTLTAAMQHAIQERAADSMERSLEIDAILGIETPFKNPLAGIKIQNPEDIESAAELLRKRWSMGAQPIASVVELLEANGVKVCDADLPSGCDGLSGWMNKVPVVILASHLNNQCITRKRLTALHELAHLLLKDLAECQAGSHEKLCSRFAGALLMPKAVFVSEIGGARQSLSIQELISIKIEYGLSIGAIICRARELNLISEALYDRYWDQNRGVIVEPGDADYAGTEKSVQFEQRVYRAAAEELISRSKAAALLNLDLTTLRDRLAVIA